MCLVKGNKKISKKKNPRKINKIWKLWTFSIYKIQQQQQHEEKNNTSFFVHPVCLQTIELKANGLDWFALWLGLGLNGINKALRQHGTVAWMHVVTAAASAAAAAV